MKKIISLVLSIILMLGAVSVSADEIYKTSTFETIAPGVELTRVKAFYSGYDLTYSYITADLTNDTVALSLLKSSKGINERETVINLAKTEEDVIAAINADFFSMSNESFSQGIEYKDGRLLQSPIDTAAFAGGFLYDDSLTLSNIDFHIMIVAPNLEYKEVYRLNKPMSLYGALLMYTSDYGDGYSPAPGNGVVEMIVEDGVVIDFNRSDVPVKIPENGYVLEISEMDPFLSANFKVGDEVKIEQYITPTLENLTMAFGGGSLLLKDGKITTFTNNVTGNNPRSAIGTDETGTKIYLMTVDGRQAGSRGVTQTELANLMKQIGCVNAMNLDGGGSSNMVSKTNESAELKTVNNPIENRKVINALGVKSSVLPDGKIAHLKLEAEKEKVYAGGEVKLKLTAIDTVYSPVSLDKKNVVFNYSKLIDKNNVFSSEKGGVYEIYATIDGVRSNSVKINVVSEIAGIDLDALYELEEGEKAELKISAYDTDGNYVSVPSDKFEIKIDGASAYYKDGFIIAKEAGEAILQVKKDDAVSYSKIKVGSGGKVKTKPQDIVNDDFNKDIPKAEKTFVYTALADEDKTLFDWIYAKKLAKILGSYDQASVLGNQTHSDLDNIYAVNYDKYMCLKKDGCIFMSLPVKNGSVRSADSKAFDKIKQDLNNSKEKNVFVTTDGYFNIDTTEFEALKILFKESGKEVFFIQRGESNSVRIIDGIRVFNVCDNKAYYDLLDATKSLKMLKFMIKDEKVYYTFENIFEI